jgi:signal transduction histidine kinase
VLRDPAFADSRPAPSGPVGGLADLDRVVSTAADSGLTVTVLPTGAAVAVPLVVDAAAHRIVQESITNVLRHSASSRACVEVEYRVREIRLRISNPAAGEPLDAVTEGSGFGIAGMRERAELLGGNLRAERTTDGGFEVRAVLPFPAPS